MTRALRLIANAAFGGGFLAGLWSVWAGLDALVLGDGGAGRGLPALAVGFTVWTALALVAGTRRP